MSGELGFTVSDPVGEILDKFNVKGYRRALYRMYVKQLVKLALKGHVTVRVRCATLPIALKIGLRYRQRGIEEKKIKFYIPEWGKPVTVWVTAKSYDELRILERETYGLKDEIMDAILEAFRKEGKIIFI